MPTDEIPSSSADRRGNYRVPARIAVRFHASEHAARALRAYSLNFSVGGLCLKTEKAYEIGQKLQLELELDGRALSAAGEVAWVRGGAIGVRFTELSRADRESLEKLVRTLRK